MNHFNHTGLDGSSMTQRIEDVGYTHWRGLAENIAAGQHPPKQVVQAWMNSPGHQVCLDKRTTYLVSLC